jgi:hypothetical protein
VNNLSKSKLDDIHVCRHGSTQELSADSCDEREGVSKARERLSKKPLIERLVLADELTPVRDEVGKLLSYSQNQSASDSKG